MSDEPERMRLSLTYSTDLVAPMFALSVNVDVKPDGVVSKAVLLKEVQDLFTATRDHLKLVGKQVVGKFRLAEDCMTSYQFYIFACMADMSIARQISIFPVRMASMALTQIPIRSRAFSVTASSWSVLRKTKWSRTSK